MSLRGTVNLILGLGLLVGASACSSGGGSGGSFSIRSCSLGCTSANSSSQVSCGVTDVALNQELRLTFNSPVNLSSVNNATFQVVELSTGKVPAGSFALDPNDDRTLIYRPQLTFDSSGNPIFGLTDGETYSFKVPGSGLDPAGPYMMSKGGKANQSRLQCTLVASLGVVDPRPGSPIVDVTVDVADVTSYDQDNFPQVIFYDQAASGAIDVFRDSSIRFVFDDVMNPGSLVNPVTGLSPTIEVKVDPDGNTNDASDQLAVDGSFTVAIDQAALTTTVVFTPSSSLPSAGSDPMNPRKIVVSLPLGITDLGGNSLINAGEVIFIPEVVPFSVVTIDEKFDGSSNEDSADSGSPWASQGGLLTGPGGGSGRLGPLLIPIGKTVELNTDSEDFSGVAIESFDPQNIVGTFTPITDGVFEFSQLRIEPGGTLRITGANPVRLMVRGETVVQGTIDLRGGSAPAHSGDDFLGGAGAIAGAGGGVGGDGGQRPDGEAFGAPDNPNDPVLYVDVDGKAGGGIPFPSTISPSMTVAAGSGGVAWPQPLTDPGLFFPSDPSDILGVQFDRLLSCKNRSNGGSGGGGGHALSGENGISKSQPGGLDLSTPAPDAPGGDAGELAIDALVKTLNPDLGLLRGGSGGGGGGGHLQDTQTDGILFTDCYNSFTGPAVITNFVGHSGAAGGGGGGGIQVQSGRRMVLNGVIDVSGGSGGGLIGQERTTAGGGGAGGAVLLQSPELLIQAVPGRVKTEGGNGGLAPHGGGGGDGAPGFIRFEAELLPTVDNEKGKILPDEEDLTALGATLDDVFTTAVWEETFTGPGAKSGAQSCWLRPDGNFFVLDFLSDDAMAGTLGWDMRLKLMGIPTPQSWRGDNDLFATPLEDLIGSDLGSSPVVVRFQGARLVRPISDPCNIPLSGGESPVFPGSVTGWVKHPDELNTFFGDPALRPNMIRFCVIWDASQLGFGLVTGIEDLTLSVLPD